jgi:Rieske 2Fe-2S family protein
VVGPPIDPALLARTLRPLREASPLPPQAVHDPAVLAWELEQLFEASWVSVGRDEDAPNPGDILTATVGLESILLMRGDDGRIRGFFNVCQHRGTRLVYEERTSCAGRLICPYHSWTYGLDGRLIASEHMGSGFERDHNGLSPVATESLDGFVFVNVSGTAGPLRDYLRDFPQRIERFGCGSLRRAARREYEAAANWKLLSENYQECYHCPTIHPELSQITPYRSGQEERSEGPWLGGPMELTEGCNTMSISGVTDRPPLPGVREDDLRLIYYYTLLPNLWVSCHADYVLVHTLWPIAPDRTRIVCEWLFDPATLDAGSDPNDAVEFWDMVNQQDWKACERVQKGSGSRGFRGGRFSELESMVHGLAAMYAASYLVGRVVRADELEPGVREVVVRAAKD